MNKPIVIGIVVAMCGVGAYFKFFAPPSGLDALLRPADAAAAGTPGIAQVLPPDLRSLPEPGRHTVVVISAKWCGACRQLDGHLNRFVHMRPDIAVRKIDMDAAGGWSGVSNAYGISVRAVPHVIIYGAAGELIAADGDGDRDGADLLIEWMNAELRNAHRG
jgi:hypothetical protein